MIVVTVVIIVDDFETAVADADVNDGMIYH